MTGVGAPALDAVPAAVALRPISIEGYPAVPRRDGGARPELRWIAIDALAVDPRYQRVVSGAGRARVAAIARRFDWGFFGPVIVAAVDGDRFAIVDGQHRTIAARLAGHDRVPCLVISADGARQARAFVAINAKATPVCAGARFRALIAAGDAEAVALKAALDEGGARVPPGPLMRARMKPGDTNAYPSLRAAFRLFDRETFVRALLALSKSPRGYVGLIAGDMLNELCLALGPLAGESRERVQARCDALDLAAISRAARAAHAEGGPKRQEALVCEMIARGFMGGGDVG